jgi:hypothetical protein
MLAVVAVAHLYKAHHLVLVEQVVVAMEVLHQAVQARLELQILVAVVAAGVLLPEI